MSAQPNHPKSLWSGFYKWPIDERRNVLETSLGLDEGTIAAALENGGLEAVIADKTIENVVGTYALPFALGLHLTVNGRERVAPMVVEEPSVVAAASNAAKMIRQGGGFVAEADEPIMIAQISLDEVPDARGATERVLAAKAELLETADRAVPGLVARGGGARDIEVRDLGDGMLVVHVLVDCRDAMGANLVNTVAEQLAPKVRRLTGGVVALRILSNLADRRCARVRASVPAHVLGVGEFSGEVVRDGIVRASRFAERDPYRAATHNKGIMNGIDAVVMATGNDWRAVEAGVHAYAARGGSYAPLCTWRANAATGTLDGTLELPLALGTVGGPSRVHRGAKLALEVADVDSAKDLAMLAACVGMASNLAALRALSTVGIQEGHMALHARSVAIAAGARGEEVESVASRIHSLGAVTFDAAASALREIRSGDQGERLRAAE
jgi:hydroxymethylglutaryl-CoA reductase